MSEIFMKCVLFLEKHGKRLIDIGILIFGDLMSFIFAYEQIYLVDNIVAEDSKSLPISFKLFVYSFLFILITIKLAIEIREFLKDLKCPKRI